MSNITIGEFLTDDPTKLSDVIDFDCPFIVRNGRAYRAPDVFAPGVYHDTDDEGSYVGDPWIETWHGVEWQFVTGYSGQYRYSGPCMHASEYVGGALARDILWGDPDSGMGNGVYCMCAVYTPDGDDPDSWVILRAEIDEIEGE